MRPVTYDEQLEVSERQDVLTNILLPGEVVERIATISPGIYWKGVLVLAASFVALFYGAFLASYIAVVALGLLILAYTTRRYILLAVTNQRVVVGAGVFAQEVFFLPLSKIETVELARSPMGMLFGYSSVIISGTGRVRLIVPFVSNPGGIAEEINRSMIEKQERVVMAAAPVVQTQP
jgi:membrane protein YdbS with pleckstrin-like domain